MNYILGIDIGTSSTKAIGYATDGSVIVHASSAYHLISPREGIQELDPQVLFDSVLEVIATAVDMAGAEGLLGMSFSSAMHGLFAVDSHGKPLTNMITWADLRSSSYALRLKNAPEGKTIYRHTGTPIHAMTPLCKLMWMKDHQPEIFKSAGKFISIKEYVFHQFFGAYLIDEPIASATGMFDIRDRRWHAVALAVAGIEESQLSKPVDGSTVMRGMNPHFATPLGIAPQTPCVIGGSDGCLAHLGSNALHPGDVSLTIGTSSAVRVMSDKPVYDESGRIFNYLLSDQLYIAGGPMNNGGNLLEWYCKNFVGRNNGARDYDWLVSQAMKVPAGSGGLVFLPYIYGERAPVWDAEAKGIFFGVSGIHTQAHFMRAILEGLSFALASLVDILEDLTGPVRNIYVSGGFTHSRTWVQLLADVLGRTVKIMAVQDASCFGAALIGMKSLGIISELGDASVFFNDGESFVPVIKDQEQYRKNKNIYAQLYDKFREIKK